MTLTLKPLNENGKLCSIVCIRHEVSIQPQFRSVLLNSVHVTVWPWLRHSGVGISFSFSSYSLCLLHL